MFQTSINRVELGQQEKIVLEFTAPFWRRGLHAVAAATESLTYASSTPGAYSHLQLLDRAGGAEGTEEGAPVVVVTSTGDWAAANALRLDDAGVADEVSSTCFVLYIFRHPTLFILHLS